MNIDTTMILARLDAEPDDLTPAECRHLALIIRSLTADLKGEEVLVAEVRKLRFRVAGLLTIMRELRTELLLARSYRGYEGGPLAKDHVAQVLREAEGELMLAGRDG